jgi:cephalosporin hydroxylase
VSGSPAWNAASALVHRLKLARQRRRLPTREVAWQTPWLAPMQIREEFEALLELAKGARAVVEIGCYHGGTLFLLCDAAADDAILVSVDIAMSRARVPLYRSFAQRRQRAHPLQADSHDPATVADVQRLLEGRLIDLLVIDGDHTYEGVRRDYELWSPLVRPGGLIAFHDIEPGLTADGVPRLWRELGGGREIVAPGRPEGGFGIGVLTR